MRAYKKLPSVQLKSICRRVKVKRFERFWLFGLIFLLVFSYSPLKVASQGKSQLKFRPIRLELLDVGSETDLDQMDMMYAQGSKGVVVVFSAMFGYADSQGEEHFPYFKVSLKKATKIYYYVDFKVSKNAKLVIFPFISGPVAGTMSEEDEFEINAKKNVYYRQVFEVDLAELPSNAIFPGVYDLAALVVPSEDEGPMLKTGGMTSVISRVWIVK